MSTQLIDKLKEMIGTEFYRIEAFPIEKGKIREFAKAIQEDNPIFYDEQAAVAVGYRSIPAPLTFSQALNFWNPNESPVIQLGLDLRYVLHGGQEYEYFKPVVAGDVLQVSCRMADAYDKEGSRGGRMLFVVIETLFTDQQGEKVLSSKQIIIQTGGVVKKAE